MSTTSSGTTPSSRLGGTRRRVEATVANGKRGVTPATNVIATLMLLVTLTLLIGGQWLLGRYARRSGGRAGLGQGGVAEIVAEGGT